MTTKSLALHLNDRGALRWLSFAIAALFVLIPVSAAALTTISQGYTTTDTVSLGSMVSLKNNTSDEVAGANSDNVGSLLGVVIGNDNSLLSLSNGKSNQVQVATSGIVQVLVSDINGDINEGDSITASPISGIGMKATDNVKVIGIAQGSLDKHNSTKHSYKDKSGKTHDVMLGQIPLLLNVSYFYKQPDKTLVPAGVQNIANALAGKKVSPLPILISMGIFIITMIVVSSIVYSMIRSSIISVGRNPMSQSAIYRDMLQMSALILGILAVATVAIYLVLTRL